MAKPIRPSFVVPVPLNVESVFIETEQPDRVI